MSSWRSFSSLLTSHSQDFCLFMFIYSSFPVCTCFFYIQFMVSANKQPLFSLSETFLFWISLFSFLLTSPLHSNFEPNPFLVQEHWNTAELLEKQLLAKCPITFNPLQFGLCGKTVVVRRATAQTLLFLYWFKPSQIKAEPWHLHVMCPLFLFQSECGEAQSLKNKGCLSVWGVENEVLHSSASYIRQNDDLYFTALV